jgi:hypothetical protein
MATLDRSFLMGHATIGPLEPREKEDFLMATYGTIRGQILARVPGIDPADIPHVLQMLVYTVCGPEEGDKAQVRHALAGLETLGSRKSPIYRRPLPRSSRTALPVA